LNEEITYRTVPNTQLAVTYQYLRCVALSKKEKLFTHFTFVNDTVTGLKVLMKSSLFLGLIPAAAWGKIPLERQPNNNIVEVAHTVPVTDAFPAPARKWDRTSDRISRGNTAHDGCVNSSVADPGYGAFF
jgi:hypothetical protein